MANTKKSSSSFAVGQHWQGLAIAGRRCFEVARVAMFVGFHDGGGRVWSAAAAVGLSFVEVRQ